MTSRRDGFGKSSLCEVETCRDGRWIFIRPDVRGRVDSMSTVIYSPCAGRLFNSPDFPGYN